MKKEIYQKPEFRFSNLHLFDGIAETCWGYGTVTVRVYKDENGNKVYDEGDSVLFNQTFNASQGNSCNNVADQVEAYIDSVESQYEGYLTKIAANENSKVLPDSSFQDFIKS